MQNIILNIHAIFPVPVKIYTYIANTNPINNNLLQLLFYLVVITMRKQVNKEKTTK